VDQTPAVPKNVSTLILPVGGCPALQHFRRQFVPRRTSILGPHITVLGDLPPATLDDAALDRLARATTAAAPICCTLDQFGVFPDNRALYLIPAPAAPLEELRNCLLKVVGGHQPTFRSPLFHLTLAGDFEWDALPALMDRAHEQLDRYLPLKLHLRELDVAERLEGVWHVRQRLTLGVNG
jgi:2'-5' RNA ligase